MHLVQVENGDPSLSITLQRTVSIKALFYFNRKEWFCGFAVKMLAVQVENGDRSLMQPINEKAQHALMDGPV
jgi:hypothetical protein